MTSSSRHNNIASVNLSSYVQVSAVEKESPKGWVDYGDKNLYPQYLAELADSSPVHGSLVRSISQMVAGKKITSDDLSAVLKMKDLGINQKLIDCVAYDLDLQGGFFLEVVWSMDRSTPASVNHLPYECCRLSIDKDSGDVDGVWYSNDWSNIRKKRNTPKYIPLFDERKKQDNPRQVLCRFKNGTTASYYGKPDYIAALNYIELSRQIGLFHVNNIQNGLFPSFIVNMNNGVPETEEEMELVKRDIERNISGARNAGKFIVMFNENRERSSEFIPFPVTDADKVYQLMEDTCTRQIMIAHRVTSPLLFGIRDNGGLGSNKDEMEVALKIFNEQVIQPSQRIIEDSIEEILQKANVSADVYIVMNDEEVVDAEQGQATTTSTTDEAVVAADVSYNGAQISSAIDIIAKVKEGILTEQQATIFLIQFLQLPEEVAKSFFSAGGAVAVEKLSAYLKKKEFSADAPTFTKDSEDYWINKLANKGEEIDSEEWELLSEEECGTSEEESIILQGLTNVNMAYGSYANGDEKSKWGDSGLYKLRYAYSTNLSEKSRDFCKAMVNLSLQGKVFRYEDIALGVQGSMSDDGVNDQFAPMGETKYDIFTWKGGAYCHHKWMRRIYFRKKERGRFLPNDGLNNDKRVGNNPFVPQKGAEGVAPIDTPTRGSLKNA